MTTNKQIAGFLASIFLLALSFYQSYLILNHIKATDLMWFIWILMIPFAIVSQAIGHLVGKDD